MPNLASKVMAGCPRSSHGHCGPCAQQCDEQAPCLKMKYTAVKGITPPHTAASPGVRRPKRVRKQVKDNLKGVMNVKT